MVLLEPQVNSETHNEHNWGYLSLIHKISIFVIPLSERISQSTQLLLTFGFKLDVVTWVEIYVKNTSIFNLKTHDFFIKTNYISSIK